MQHIVFFDDSCGLCQRSVIFFLKRDKKKQFFFAPLSGKTAEIELKEWLKDHSQVDSIVLVEKRDDGSKKTFYYSKAILSLLWHLGGIWSVLGLLSFLPDVLLLPADLVYRQVAKHRRDLCLLPTEIDLQKQHESQFLP